MEQAPLLFYKKSRSYQIICLTVWKNKPGCDMLKKMINVLNRRNLA